MSHQTTVFGEPLETAVEIEALGRVIRPFKRAVGQVVDEFRLHCREDELRVSAVDSPNVMGIEVSLNPNALERYAVSDPPVKIGVATDYLGSALQHARYGKTSDDTVTIHANHDHIETTTHRTFGETDVMLRERVPVLDEKAIREDFDAPDLDMDESVQLSTEAFTKAIGVMDTTTKDEIKVIARDGAMALTQERNKGAHQRDIELDCETQSGAEAIYTADYIADIASVLNVSYATIESVTWSNEFPMYVHFDREDMYSGSIMVAPRIQSDGP